MTNKLDMKLADEIALFAQELLKEKAYYYKELLKLVAEKFKLSPQIAGTYMTLCYRRGNFLAVTFKIVKLMDSVVYLPEHKSEAYKLFRQLKEETPFILRTAGVNEHLKILEKVKEIAKSNAGLSDHLIAEIVSEKLRMKRHHANRYIAEIKE